MQVRRGVRVLWERVCSSVVGLVGGRTSEEVW